VQEGKWLVSELDALWGPLGPWRGRRSGPFCWRC